MTTIPEGSLEDRDDLGLPDGVESPKIEEPPTVDEVLAEHEARLNQPSTRRADLGAVKATAETTGAVEGLELDSPAAARVMGQLQEQIAALRSEVVALRQAGPATDDTTIDLGPSGFPWQYYRRPDRGVEAGWIKVAPGGATPRGRRSTTAFTHYMGKGMRPITGYGVCDPPASYRAPGGQYVPMLRNGGAREFPASQVLAYKWHVNPPMPGLVFPEYEKVKDTVRHFMCDDCDYDTWMLDDDKETGMICFRHLRQPSEDGRHNYSRDEATAILMDMKIPLAPGRYAGLAADIRVAKLRRERENPVPKGVETDHLDVEAND